MQTNKNENRQHRVRHKSSTNRSKFIDLRNHCKSEIVKRRHTEITRKRIKLQKLGTHNLWKICHSVVNKG